MHLPRSPARPAKAPPRGPTIPPFAGLAGALVVDGNDGIARLTALLLQHCGFDVRALDGLLVPHEDEHQNEYLPACEERLAWLTGFSGSAGVALVLADRAVTVRRHAEQAYPRTRKTRVTYSGNGCQAGYREGQKADIGGAKVRSRSGSALSR